MMTGLGGLDEGIFTWDSYFDTSHSGADKWEAALAKAGEKGSAYDSVTDAWLWYWTSSESTVFSAVALTIDATGTGSDYGFGWFDAPKDHSADEKCRFRPILAF
jgi:hypothetical protein